MRARKTVIYIVVFASVVGLAGILFAVFFGKWQSDVAKASGGEKLYYEYTDPITVDIGYDAATELTAERSVRLRFSSGETVALVGKGCNLELSCYVWNDELGSGSELLAYAMTGEQANVPWELDRLCGVIFGADGDRPLYFKADFAVGLDDGYVYTFDLSGMNDFEPTGQPKPLV